MQGVIPRLVIGVPTRGRESMVLKSIYALGEEVSGLPVKVVVSENTGGVGSRSISELCGHYGFSHLVTGMDFGMAEHWEWLLNSMEPYLYATVLTDRSLIVKGAVKQLLDALDAKNYPPLMAYKHKAVRDDFSPIPKSKRQFSNRLVKIRVDQMVEFSSRGRYSLALPRMLNSVASEQLISAIRTKFGSVFGGLKDGTIAPDYAFAYRSMSLLEYYWLQDSPYFLSYGFAESNGRAFRTGSYNSAALDFMNRSYSQVPMVYSRFPEVYQTLNSMVHEYERVRATSGANWPETNWQLLALRIFRELRAGAMNSNVKRWMIAVRKEISFLDMMKITFERFKYHCLKTGWGIRRASADRPMVNVGGYENLEEALETERVVSFEVEKIEFRHHFF